MNTKKKSKQFTKDEMIKAVEICGSFRELGRYLGISHTSAQKIINQFDITVSHFLFGRKSLEQVGKKYNLLTIKEVFQDTGSLNSKKRWYCFCDCDCGVKNFKKRLDGVISGHVYSCGCYKSSQMRIRGFLGVGENNPTFTGIKEISGTYLNEIKRGAERREIIYDLSKEYLWNLFLEQNKKCALTGIDLNFSTNSNNATASLDRINSKIGYIVGNVQWVHKDINLMKMNLHEDYFIALCEAVIKWNTNE